ncbi:Hsp70 family protein [Dactylosporangium sp. CA-233914]|uniref:Hsp70 family protein n=1 Tax=Dactylosporangium sp. CA-233914 TaxID=3239934 RepID=UPI003D8E8331
MGGHQLGVDFGTSNTVAVLRRADGRVDPLLFDSSPLLSSGVAAAVDGGLLTGADAERATLADPAGFEPTPKRCIDDGRLWLGSREVPVVDAVAAVLGRVAAEAHRVAGEAAGAVVLTHPASWSGRRLELLAAAARTARLGEPRFVPEPVAAAAYFTTILGREIPADDHLVVYDLGAGTFDVSLVRRTAQGAAASTSFDVVAADGLPDVGGLDLDAAVVAHARRLTETAADAWGRLDWPRTKDDELNRRALWTAARGAKEQLSRHSAADLYVPLADVTLHITRDEFDRAAEPLLARTVACTTNVLREAKVPRERIAGVLLVGGSSRIPLAANLLHRALKIAPTAIEQPELVVALGSLAAVAAPGTSTQLAPPPLEPAGLNEPVKHSEPIGVLEVNKGHDGDEADESADNEEEANAPHMRLATARGDGGRLHLFHITADGSLLQRTLQESRGWGTWSDLSLPAEAHDVAATCNGDDGLDLFVADRHGILWYRSNAMGRWHPWEKVDIDTELEPIGRLAAASGGQGYRDVYAVGGDGRCGHRHRSDHEGWHHWWVDTREGRWVDVALTSRWSSRLEVALLRDDGGVEYRSWILERLRWTDWQDLGAPTRHRPDVRPDRPECRPEPPRSLRVGRRRPSQPPLAVGERPLGAVAHDARPVRCAPGRHRRRHPEPDVARTHRNRRTRRPLAAHLPLRRRRKGLDPLAPHPLIVSRPWSRTGL